MQILLQTPRDEGHQWFAALASALPDAAISVWPDAPAAPDYALVWKPPAELFARARTVKAIFNLGAGVEVFLDLQQERYAPQLDDYGEAAGATRRGLYFPLHKGWREW